MNFNNNDNPITNIKDDILGFEPLAKRIATSITDSNIDTTNSFTISIEGQWGSGKTSLVNLIRNEIKDEVITLRFNPWMVNSFEQLIEYFFSEFLKIIIKEAPLNKDKIIKNLKSMLSFLTPDSIRMGTKTLSATYKTKDLLFSEPTIYQLKSEINTHLKQLNKRIVIIVDDIDRLTDKETETFFRLIKGIADFDNLIYLLLYDKAIVSKSLEQFKQENGEKYLDKIVQYSISIPKVYNSVLNKILFEKLDKIKIYNFNEDKWNALVPLLAKYIINIRDINRVINVILFEYPQIATEVEFTDFFIISLIKVQKYELYEFIRDKKYIFKSSNSNKLLAHANKNEKDKLETERKEFYTQIINFTSDFTDLFYMLFPDLSNEQYYTWNRVSVHKNKPLNNKHYFDNYFTFSVADNKISTQEYQKLSKKVFLSDYQEFEKAILSINDIDKTLLFLEMFNSIDKQKTLENLDYSKNVIITLLTIHKKLPNSNSWYSSPSTLYFHTAKDIFENTKENKEILESIYLKDNFISLESKLSFYREMKKIYDFNRKFDKEIIDKIENNLIEKVKLIKLSHLIKEKKDLNTISSIYTLISSYKLLGLSLETFLKELDDMIFKSQDDFFNILMLFKSEISVSGGKPFPSISASNIGKYTNLDIKDIEKYMNKLDKDTFTSKELEIYKAWEFRYEY